MTIHLELMRGMLRQAVDGELDVYFACDIFNHGQDNSCEGVVGYEIDDFIEEMDMNFNRKIDDMYELLTFLSARFSAHSQPNKLKYLLMLSRIDQGIIAPNITKISNEGKNEAYDIWENVCYYLHLEYKTLAMGVWHAVMTKGITSPTVVDTEKMVEYILDSLSTTEYYNCVMHSDDDEVASGHDSEYIEELTAYISSDHYKEMIRQLREVVSE